MHARTQTQTSVSEYLKDKETHMREHCPSNTHAVPCVKWRLLFNWATAPRNISVHVPAAAKDTLNICGVSSCEASESSSPSSAKYLMGLSDGHNRF